VVSEGEVVEPWIVVRGVHDARSERDSSTVIITCGFPRRVFPVRGETKLELR
jgi:adenylate kinase family enzyme